MISSKEPTPEDDPLTAFDDDDDDEPDEPDEDDSGTESAAASNGAPAPAAASTSAAAFNGAPNAPAHAAVSTGSASAARHDKDEKKMPINRNAAEALQSASSADPIPSAATDSCSCRFCGCSSGRDRIGSSRGYSQRPRQSASRSV